MDYYNDIEPYAAEWIRNLSTANHVPFGAVDTRSILDVTADSLAQYRRAHFFAGIGGWALALKMAGWPEGVPVWTGSCPCQPFSIAGKKKGEQDERHLWPAFRDLIRRVGSGVFPLAHGVPARVGKLRAYGNAIVPEVAALFVQAYIESLPR